MTTNQPSIVPVTAVRHKEAGGRFFAAKEYQSALDSYQTARECLEDHPALVWPAHERFALTLHSNMALCLLKLQRPRQGVEECQKAATLPVFQVQAPDSLREKILARHAEALLDWRKQDAPKVSNEDIWSGLDLARRFGYLSRTMTSWETRRTFLYLGARLVGDENAVQSGVQTWTDHFVRTQIVTAQKAVEARQAFQEQAIIIARNKEHNDKPAKKRRCLESLALDTLESLLPNAKASVGEVCRVLIAFLMEGTSPSEAVGFLRGILEQGGLHASQVDEDGAGYFLWAICFGLTASPAGDGPVDIFIALLALLVDEFGVWIDQRAKSGESQSRNPLQYVVKSGQPRAVRAMLDRGAEVNLRDEDGWTALATICMNSIKTPSEGGPSVADRVETARLLLEAGADFEAESLNGFTPLLALCTKPCAPLLKLLLSHGADPNHVGRSTGFSPHGMILEMDKHSEGAAECLKLLSSCNGAGSFMEEEAKADKFEELLNDLVPDCYLRVYFREPPTQQEFALMLSHCGEACRAGMRAETSGRVSFFDEQAAHAKLFAKWRDRGLIYRANMINFEGCVIDPIQHCIGFAVPSDAVLQRMEQFGPMVEVGAGTGYFTAILQARGVDAVAYDLSPPTKDHEASGFFSHTYTDVQEGDAKSLFADDPSLASRTLLIV